MAKKKIGKSNPNVETIRISNIESEDVAPACLYRAKDGGMYEKPEDIADEVEFDGDVGAYVVWRYVRDKIVHIVDER